jgi:flagellar export protein FliJ
MPISPALRKLLRIRELEEEQSRIALETALGEMNRLKRALAGTAQSGQAARRLFASGVQSGNLRDRVAGLQEMRSADNLAGALSRTLVAAGPEVARLRERFLATRVQRRQAESLVNEGESRAETEEERRNQRDLDDLHRARTQRKSEDRG